MGSAINRSTIRGGRYTGQAPTNRFDESRIDGGFRRQVFDATIFRSPSRLVRSRDDAIGPENRQPRFIGQERQRQVNHVACGHLLVERLPQYFPRAGRKASRRLASSAASRFDRSSANTIRSSA